jgi:hypothetical protein
MGSSGSDTPILRRLATLLLTLLLTVGTAAAPQSRVALVIGNADYPASPLRNPANDARSIARRLGELGFTVIVRVNADRETMAQSIQDFASRLDDDSVGLFYYAGHGIQARGRNYLIPIDADVTSEGALKFEAIDVTAILEDMELAQNKLNLVILDACRNNPFERRFRGGSKGLAAIDAARGTMIAYATAPGSVAADGSGDNGLYTEELLGALAHPGLKAEEVFKRVRIGVSEKSRGQQVPWESSSLTGDFIFNPVDENAAATASGSMARDREALFWESVKDSGDPRVFQEYLNEYPDGTFVGLARLRIETLGGARSGSGTGTTMGHSEEIARLLDASQRDMASRRLTSPPGENAVEKLRNVLALDPDNTDAKQGLATVVDRYVAWAYAAMERAEYDKAESFLARADTVAPDAVSLTLAKVRLTDERDRVRREAEIRRQAEQEAAREAQAARQRQAERDRRMAERMFRDKFGSQGRLLAASSEGVTVRLQGRVQEIQDFATSFCQLHGRRSSLSSTNPLTHERSFVCH